MAHSQGRLQGMVIGKHVHDLICTNPQTMQTSDPETDSRHTHYLASQPLTDQLLLWLDACSAELRESASPGQTPPNGVHPGARWWRCAAERVWGALWQQAEAWGQEPAA